MTTGSSKWTSWLADAEKKAYAEGKLCALPETREDEITNEPSGIIL